MQAGAKLPNKPSELAHETCAGVATIIRIERDHLKSEPHYSTLRKFARVLDIEPTELLED